MYYGANVGAKLFMGRAVTAPLPDADTDVYDEVPLTGSIQPPSNAITTAGFNVTNDSNRRSLGGKLGDQSVAGNVVIDDESAIHDDMYDDSIFPGGRKRNWYLHYPNGTRFLAFRGFLSQWEEEAFDAGEDAKEHRSNFTVSVDGGAARVTDAPGTIGGP